MTNIAASAAYRAPSTATNSNCTRRIACFSSAKEDQRTIDWSKISFSALCQ
jgi:hypothetical protein